MNPPAPATTVRSSFTRILFPYWLISHRSRTSSRPGRGARLGSSGGELRGRALPRPAIDVLEVKLNPPRKSQIASAAGICQRHVRPGRMLNRRINQGSSKPAYVPRWQRPRPNERHFADEHVPELRQFIE